MMRAAGPADMITTRSEIFALGQDDSREPVTTTSSSILVRGEGQ